MLRKIDEKLLFLTNQFVKKFNWLTGRDNFFLARGCCILSSFLYWVFVLKGEVYELICFPLFTFPILFLMVNLEECLSEEERLIGAKDLLHFCLFSFLRKFHLIGVLCFHILFFLHPKPYGLFFTEGYSFMTFYFFLLSVDKPPYSRSKAWELLKGQLKNLLSLAPAPVPVLVPVKK